MSPRRPRTRGATPGAAGPPRPQAGTARPRKPQAQRSPPEARVRRRSVRELASGLAHDLNNTLHAMRLRLELLRRDTEFAARDTAHLDALQRIVRDEGLTLRIETQVPLLPEVSGDAVDLRFVFLNLLLNARDAMPRGGTIRVRGAVVDGNVSIAVEDEGTGIPVAHLRDIFQPFFTTKGLQGTGLGLSMSWHTRGAPSAPPTARKGVPSSPSPSRPSPLRKRRGGMAEEAARPGVSLHGSPSTLLPEREAGRGPPLKADRLFPELAGP